MDAIRDLVDTLGITPETFDTLIIIIIVIGSIWAGFRIYQDLTRDISEDEPTERPKIQVKK